MVKQLKLGFKSDGVGSRSNNRHNALDNDDDDHDDERMDDKISTVSGWAGPDDSSGLTPLSSRASSMSDSRSCLRESPKDLVQEPSSSEKEIKEGTT